MLVSGVAPRRKIPKTLSGIETAEPLITAAYPRPENTYFPI